MQPPVLQLRVRYALGGGPAAQSLPALVGSDALGGKTVDGIRRLLATKVISIPERVLELSDSLRLRLTPHQVLSLQPIADSLQRRASLVIEQLARAIVEQDGRPSQPPPLITALLNEALAVIDRGSAGDQLHAVG